MKRATNWLLTILHDEVQAAFILIGVTAVTLVLALSPMQSSIVSFADLELWSHSGMTLRHFSSEWLLCIFFIIAGIELRYELQLGSLNSLKSALVPVMSAVFGMAIPAAIYIALAKDISTFGIVMPTDLPFALAAIAIFGKKMPLQFRAFVLSLAVVDDFLSVVALSLTSGHFEIHPTLIAVLIGLSLPLVRAERIHNVLRPVSNGVALPLFAFTALALPLSFANFFTLNSLHIAIARVIGKPVGIFVGALIAVYIFRAIASIPWRLIFTAGFVCSVGFSVSLLFISVSGIDQNSAAVLVSGIVACIPLSMAVGGMTLRVRKP
ncbi:MAG: Na(+)/H(+) antiporter NhaA 1 [Actinomycetota bacterium]|jgi:NhaA family Na+:H+ antiporter